MPAAAQVVGPAGQALAHRAQSAGARAAPAGRNCPVGRGREPDPGGAQRASTPGWWWCASWLATLVVEEIVPQAHDIGEARLATGVFVSGFAFYMWLSADPQLRRLRRLS